MPLQKFNRRGRSVCLPLMEIDKGSNFMMYTKNLNMQVIAEKVIIFLIYFVIFETLITKYVFDNMIFKYVAEAVIYVLAVYCIVLRIKENKKFKILKHEVLLVVLSIYLILTTVIINRIDMLIFILSIRTLYRYIVLYFIVTNIEFTEESTKRILKHIKLSGIIVLAFGTLQILLPRLMNPFLTPKAYQLGDMVREDSITVIDGKAIFSLLERYDRYGIFLIIIMSVLLAGGYKKKSNIVVMILAVINMIYTYSRQAWVGLAVAVLVGLILKKRFFPIFFTSGAAALGMAAVLTTGNMVQDVYFGSPMQRVLQVFSSSYIKTSVETARLRIFVDILPKFLYEFKLYTIFGLGIGNFAALANSMTNYELYMRYFLLFNVEYSGIYHISDVYWIELVMELGLLGITIFFIYFVSAFKYYYSYYTQKISSFSKELNLLALRLIAATVVINFFGPNMLITGYSFFLWLLLGLVINMNNLERRRGNVQ